MNQLSIIIPTIRKEWKQQAVSAGIFYMIVWDIAASATMAWILRQSGRTEMLAYLCIGVALMTIWKGTVAISGWSLSNEINASTLEFTLITRASLPVILFSKILAQIIYELPGAIASIAAVLLIIQHIPYVANPAALIFSVVLAIVGLGIISQFLAGIVVMAGGRSGFFMGIVPLGYIICGFILPIKHLPYNLAVPARLMPSAWAMEAVWQSVTGSDTLLKIVQNWGVSILLSVCWFMITAYICRIVEKRIRVKGTLGKI